MASPTVEQLLSQHQFLEMIETGEGEEKCVRIKCHLTQHEMLPRPDMIVMHVKSKKFLKARDWYCHDYSQYEPYIVPHRRLPKSLFCNVTNTILNRIPSEVEKHVQGKRYKRLKEHVQITLIKSKDNDEMETTRDFDANAFEFENSQVIYSDDEDGQQEGGDDEFEEGLKTSKMQQEEDDMSDLYPDVESEEEEVKTKDEDGDETIREKPNKKRPTKDSSITKKTRHRTKKAKKAS